MEFIQYQQTKNLCGLYSILTAFSNATGKRLSQEHIDMFITELRLKDDGVLVMALLPAVKKIWNKVFPKVVCKVVDTSSDLFIQELCRGKYACTGFRFNDDIFADVVSDGVRDRSSEQKTRGGHAVTATSDGDVIIILDNYASDPKRSGSNVFTISFKAWAEVKKYFTDKSYIIHKTRQLGKN